MLVLRMFLGGGLLPPTKQKEVFLKETVVSDCFPTIEA